MKSPRRIILTKEMITHHQLSTQPPPPDALFWKMWNACTQISQAALETQFIQGIKQGNLDPVEYGGFNISDAYYCFNGAQDYQEAESRAQDALLKAFLLAKYKSYDKYNQEFPTVWHLKDAAGVVPTEVCRQYSDFESSIAAHQDPIYAVVVMLPCEYLWAWLASQLAPPSPGNLYAPWITGNHDPSGGFAMGNFIDSYQAQYPDSIDEAQAIAIYTQAMEYEQKNFATATA